MIQNLFKRSYWNFLSKERGLYWRIAIIIVIAIATIVLYHGVFRISWLTDLWDNVWSPVLSIFTAVIAFYIYMDESNKAYLDSLPKRLSIRFSLDNKLVSEIINAPLASEADIRAWGQQLGKQQWFNQWLSFDDFKVITKSKTIKLQGQEYRKYAMDVFLTSFPGFNLEGEPDILGNDTVKKAITPKLIELKTAFEQNGNNIKWEYLTAQKKVYQTHSFDPISPLEDYANQL